ncbi:MAG TPA: alpha/beta hydrolase [Xanthobacteraceae bacterium]|nr:alpha/beta hydrolase [Xanthobacteraceae bacterium]
MALFVVAHGAWSAGWAWKKMHPLMRAGGHQLVTPTYTGIGERAHLAHPDIHLDTHIEDVLQVLRFEDLHEVILIGHSYGGMVATGVADRARERIAELVYLDAFAPQDGQSAFDMGPPERAEGMRTRARTEGEGWRIPPNPLPPDTPASDQAWAAPRRVGQPLKTFEQKLRLRNGPLTLPRHYIYCQRCAPGDGFRPSYERARREGWDHHEIDASHNPHITAPQALMALLETIARGGTQSRPAAVAAQR